MQKEANLKQGAFCIDKWQKLSCVTHTSSWQPWLLYHWTDSPPQFIQMPPVLQSEMNLYNRDKRCRHIKLPLCEQLHQSPGQWSDTSSTLLLNQKKIANESWIIFMSDPIHHILTACCHLQAVYGCVNTNLFTKQNPERNTFFTILLCFYKNIGLVKETKAHVIIGLLGLFLLFFLLLLLLGCNGEKTNKWLGKPKDDRDMTWGCY